MHAVAIAVPAALGANRTGISSESPVVKTCGSVGDAEKTPEGDILIAATLAEAKLILRTVREAVALPPTTTFVKLSGVGVTRRFSSS
jgi:hypothetical protein